MRRANSFLSAQEVESIGFRCTGKNVLISSHACFYNAHLISIGDNVRIDDFCIINGQAYIGNHCHIAPQCIISGATKDADVTIHDFCTFAYGVKLFAKSDDYSGVTLTGATVPSIHQRHDCRSIIVGKYSIVGASSVVFPGSYLAEGTAIGAMSLLKGDKTEPWSVYVGVPAYKLKKRQRDMIDLARAIEDE
jgi:acetyltransferase-like isoleucine patch superfamily enzyme